MNKELLSLLTPKEVADTLGISVGTLTVWRSVGRYELPWVKVGSRVMYRPEDVKSFIDHHTLNRTA